MSVLILMYHGIEQRAGPLFVDPSLFAEHLDAIAASELPALTISEIGDCLREGRLPERGVALTFDDGFASVVEEAAPRLLERGLSATIFCVAGSLGRSNEWPSSLSGAPIVQLADASELSQLAEAGFEIGGHGLTHAPLDTADPGVIRREVTDGRTMLECTVGTGVHSFAYPYGAAPSAAAARVVSESYRTACTTSIGRVEADSDPLALPRVDAHYLRSPERLASALDGGSNEYLTIRRLAANARRRLRRDYSA
jgi:peptidoglycan/xylan/chitin deacetylase (PgdA/CDA1 family)